MTVNSDFVTSARDILRRSPHGIPILMYHKIGPEPWQARSRALYASPALLRRQLSGLRRAGLRSVDPAEARSARDAFAITIDDGFAGVLAHGLPVLQALGMRATLFVVAGLPGGTNEWDLVAGEPRERLMDAGEIRAWLHAGQRIGSHTLTHPRLTGIPAAQAREEVHSSRKRLEDEYGVPIEDFCYPFGDHNEAVRGLVEEAGYRTACTIEPRVTTAADDPLRLPRLLARYRWPGPKAVVARLLGGLVRR